MSHVSRLYRIIKLNWRQMVEFELLYRLLSIFLFTPILLFMLKSSMKISGYKYITVENIYSYLTSPATIGMMILIVLTTTFFTLLEVSANIYIIDQSYQRVVANIREVMIFAGKNAIRGFSLKNLLLAIVVSVVMLFINTGVASGYLGVIEVPDFILALFTTNKYLRWGMYTLVVVFGVLFIRWIYVFHYFTLEKCSFVKACKRSSDLNKGHKIKDFLIIIFLELLCGICFALTAALMILLLIGIYQFISDHEMVYYILLAIILVVITMLVILFLALSVPMLYACISVMFYRHKVELGERIVHSKKSKYQFDFLKDRKIKRIEHTVLVVTILATTVYVYMLAFGKVNLNVEYVKTMEVTAHRGASAKYPENTMSAFKGAVELRADWIELDVQQTKDGKIIVMHDSNLKRTTGKNKNIWKVNYADLEKLECGKWFSKEFKGEPIPLLEEVVKFAKESNIRLNIELKPTGHEKKFEEKVVDIIKEQSYAERCVITSQDYTSLKKVKNYDESITTVYVMGIAYGNIVRLKAADNFSVKSYYVTDELVRRVHNAGKQLYVWTVNQEQTIDRMIAMNVDNIITDNISLAKKCIYKKKAGNWITKYLDYFLLQEN